MSKRIPKPLAPELAERLSAEIAKLCRTAMTHEWNEDLETTGFQDIALAVQGGPLPPEGRFEEFLQFLRQRSEHEHDPQVENRAMMVRQAFDGLVALVDARARGDQEEISQKYGEARTQVKRATTEINRSHAVKNRSQLLQAAMKLATANEFIEADTALEQITKGDGRGAA